MAAVLADAAVLSAALAASTAQAPAQPPDPEARGVAYLSLEVPRWRLVHPCYSCHNNGDATRALIAAAGRGHAIGDALDDTLAWLATPDRWDSNQLRGGSEDLPLARIQFASALASMLDAGRATQAALDRAANLLVVHQRDDGSWTLNPSQPLGGPTFYGTSLATAVARRVLAKASAGSVQMPLARAASWLRSASVETVTDASAVLLGLEGDTDPAADAQRRRALDVLRSGQGPDGGWGPYVTSQSEPFDTALAILGLRTLRNADLDETIRRARASLITTQNPDGSWPETTRPPNGESYAQRISTTAWALLALLASG
jgi:hypothetical protein